MSDDAIRELTPPQAWQLLQSRPDAILLDVRSSMEYQYVGHPPGAVHVPLMEPPAWQADPGFVERVREILGAGTENRPLLALCRSGKRSEAAAMALLANGFTEVYNIIEGFEGDLDEQRHRNSHNGWRFHGLPWEQS